MAGHTPTIQSLVLADRIYQDAVTSKFVLAGTFNIIKAPAFPTLWRSGAALYCAVTDIREKLDVGLLFKEALGSILFQTAECVSLKPGDHTETHEILFDLPHLPLPAPGDYEFVVCNWNKERARLASLLLRVKKDGPR